MHIIKNKEEQMNNEERLNLGRLLGKIVITGEIECLTGLHIGGLGGELEIGGIDNPVVRDPMTNEPYIPGSSLKGKLRSLLERHLYNGKEDFFNRDIGKGGKRHECNTAKEAANCPICRLFGSTGKEDEENQQKTNAKKDATNFPSPLLIRDSFLKNTDALKNINSELLYTEWKAENTLDRVTAAANPRNIERVPKGAKFSLEIIYAVFDGRIDVIKGDLDNLHDAFKMLELDALGGSGSRGYGKVKITVSEIKFEKFEITDDKVKEEINKKIQESKFKN